MTRRSMVVLLALAFASPHGDMPRAHAQMPAPDRQAEDAARCRALGRAVFNRPAPRTITLTDIYGRRAEGLIGTIDGGRYPGLLLGREEREQFRYCMYAGGLDPDR